MSPRERLATDKQEPRFDRKHGGVSPFGLTLEQGKKMSSTDQGKPAGKSGRRKGKGERGKKAVSQQGPPESPAPVQLQSPDQDQQLQPEPVHAESATIDQQPAVTEQVVTEQVVAEQAVAEPVAAVAATIEPQPTVAPSPTESSPVAPPPAELTPVSLQTIANAYRDYTRKSLEEFGSFVEQLSGVRSLDKAMTVQSEFVKRAYETSVAELQKICELHSKLARQTFQPLQGLVGKAREPHGKS